jgi:hypothetical protein
MLNIFNFRTRMKLRQPADHSLSPTKRKDPQKIASLFFLSGCWDIFLYENSIPFRFVHGGLAAHK